ncbi:signal transduction histidine kinase [Mycolicibacterium mucogenicum 261Sha1.1M5]|nr:signal transduction histidine kinase [Mycolicibacterium mucogenicum 261Sha1.1M5]
MTKRLFLILGGITLTVVVAAWCLLAGALTREAGRELQIDRARSLGYFAALAEEADRTGDTATVRQAIDRHRELFGEEIIVDLRGERLRTAPGARPGPDVEPLVRLALRNQAPTDLAPLSPLRSDPMLLARPFGTAAQVTGSVVMVVDPSRAVTTLRWQLGGLAAAGIALEAVLLVAVLALTRWILRPVRELDGALEHLTRSERPALLEEAGPPELRALTRRYRRMAEALTASLDHQRALTGETSHQVRNALGAAMIRVDLLELAPASEHAERVRDLGRELQRLERTLDGMMRLAHTEHRLAQLRADRATGGDTTDEDEDGPAEHADLAQVLREAARAREVPVRLALGRDSDRAAGAGATTAAIPRFEAEQIIGELLSNAEKYGAGPIIAGAGAHSGGVRVWVRDRGAGLTAAELRSVRTRFWRSHRHRSIIGHGLGLSMVERIATAHRGRLELSTPAGGGLLAVVWLPASARWRDGGPDSVSSDPEETP